MPDKPQEPNQTRSIEIDMSKALDERKHSLLAVCQAIRDLASIVDQFCIEAK